MRDVRRARGPQVASLRPVEGPRDRSPNGPRADRNFASANDGARSDDKLAWISFEPQHLETSGARARAAGTWISTLGHLHNYWDKIEIIFELRSAIEGWGAGSIVPSW